MKAFEIGGDDILIAHSRSAANRIVAQRGNDERVGKEIIGTFTVFCLDDESDTRQATADEFPEGTLIQAT